MRTGEYLVWQRKRTWHGTCVWGAVNRYSSSVVFHAAGKRACLASSVAASTSSARIKRRRVTRDASCMHSNRSATDTSTCPVSTTTASMSAVRWVDTAQFSCWVITGASLLSKIYTNLRYHKYLLRHFVTCDYCSYPWKLNIKSRLIQT